MKHEITDQGDSKRYWTQIPNIIFDLGLKPQEFVLYSHLKRAAGSNPNGKCTKSTATLSRETGLGAGTVSRAKTALETKRSEIHNKPLIKTKEIPNPRGGKAYQEISITDIWKLNMEHFTSSTVEVEDADQVPVEVDPSSRPISRVEIKKNYKEELREEERSTAFWNLLKTNPAYSHVDLVVERGKMEAWLSLPKNKHRKLTERFALNWLNRTERPIQEIPARKVSDPEYQKELEERWRNQKSA